MKGINRFRLIISLAFMLIAANVFYGCKPEDSEEEETDNPSTPGFIIGAISGNTGEGGSTATYTVRLDTQPDGRVVIDIVSSDTGEGTVSPASITFTSSDYDTDQTVTVTGVDDSVDDGDQPFTVQQTINTASTTDTVGYSSLDPDDVSVTNSDDDTAGFTISAISNSTGEDGTSATFTIVLTSEPDGDVVINVSSSDTGEGTVSPSNLTYTNSSWNITQTVTVTGVSDSAADGDQNYTIQLSINAGATQDTTGYAGLDPADVSVVNLDNTFKLPDTGQSTSYTSTAGEDSDYTINSPSLTDNSDDTIIDNHTGRVWQKEDDNVARNWSDADTYCTNLTLAGQSDWRLPNPKELMTIVDYEVTTAPTINATYFPNTNATVYWASATDQSDTNRSLYVQFLYGQVWGAYRTSTFYVRCVRGGSGSDIWPLSFNDLGNGTVEHPATSLIWQQEDDNTTRTWEEALTYCEGLSHAGSDDWRLPNATEIQSIVDYTKYNPAIDTTAFPNTNASDYWSSTTLAVNTGNAVTLDFETGFVSVGSGKTTSFHVRCVRGGQ